MDCEAILNSLSAVRKCRTEGKYSAVTTDCFYPSFDPVEVFIRWNANSFLVTDRSRAAASVISSGKDGRALDAAVAEAVKKFHLSRKNYSVRTEVSKDWLPHAVLAVANASAYVAALATSREFETDRAVLLDSIETALVAVHHDFFAISRDFTIRKEPSIRGRSGKYWKFDYAVMVHEPILIKTVSPHGNSINANFVAFSDTDEEFRHRNISVYSRNLADTDVNLLNQVTSVVPVDGLYNRVKMLTVSDFT